MKLSLINEIGHWDLAPGKYPNSLLRTKKGKPKRHSFLLCPSDRERFLEWGKPATTSEGYMKLRAIVEYQLVPNQDWGPERQYVGRKAWSIQPQTPPSTRMEPEEEPNAYDTEDEEDIPGDAVPIRLSYAVYKIFQRYLEDSQDPLYGLLKRRGDKVDWVTVYATPDEIDRLAAVTEYILLYGETNSEVRTAQSLKDQLDELF